MRRQPVILAGLLATLAFGACNQRPLRCAEAYEHLLELAQRTPTAAEHDRFVSACVTAWDEARVQCLADAATPEDALACKPKKIRPG